MRKLDVARVGSTMGAFLLWAWALAWLAGSAVAQTNAGRLEALSLYSNVLRIPLDALATWLPDNAQLRLYTITDRPGLYVLHAPNLADQGAMFSRVVALMERRDMPRDRVVTMAEIAAHARRFGADPAGLTAGNNFSTAQIAHFFEVAREQGVVLTDGERALRTILVQWGLMRQVQQTWEAVSSRDFLITIPGIGPAPGGEVIDRPIRAAILSHELGHWQYFSDRAYAHACRAFWWQSLSYEERAELTRQLEDMGYDPSDRIVIDEMQAYLLHTPAPYMPIVDVPGPQGIDVARVRERLKERVARKGL
ncbi:hypothetical protein PQR34_00480 [Paraburkholderia sediminicola]|uniref:hypothetical protein n=1 Tax=Paraburkholderia sediminicola TaxID=458836 RepID=UPI0038BC936D